MKIKKAFQKPYIFWVAGIFLGYIFLNIILSEFYLTAQYIPYFLDTILWGKFLLSVLFSLSIGILISINVLMVYFYYIENKKNMERKKNIQAAAVTGAGTIGGLATGICSACVSVFPFFFSIFGITISFASLPFQGLEIQALVIILLFGNIYYLQKNSISSAASESSFRSDQWRSEGIFDKEDDNVRRRKE